MYGHRDLSTGDHLVIGQVTTCPYDITPSGLLKNNQAYYQKNKAKLNGIIYF